MRGNPVMQWLLFAALWLLLLIPIARITRQTTPDAVAPPRERTSPMTPVWLSVRFSENPRSFSLFQDERLLWAETEPRGRFFEREVSLFIDAFGAEVALVAELSDSETAVEVAVEPEGMDRRARTLWVSGHVDDPFLFSWGRHE